MSFCSECGAALPSGARFCVGCGTPVRHRTTDPVQQPTDDAGQPDYRNGSWELTEEPIWTVTDPDGFSGAQVRTEGDSLTVTWP